MKPGLSTLAQQRRRLIAQRALRSLTITQSLSLARVGYDESLRPLRQARRARRASLLGRLSAINQVVDGVKQRIISDAHHLQRLPGTRVRSEGDPNTNDLAVDEAYEYMGDTYDFYATVFNRDSIDDDGMALKGSVHYGKDYDNAFWDGRMMVYGDGDGEVFDRFTKSVDVIGHELTHGVIQEEAGLIYWGQPGALNESLADVFGSLVKQFKMNQRADQADWIIGSGLLMPGINGVGIRSMKNPVRRMTTH